MQATPLIVQTSQALPMTACPFVTNAYLTFAESALKDLNLNSFLIWTGTETRKASMKRALANIAFMLEFPQHQPDASTITRMTAEAHGLVLVSDHSKATQVVKPVTANLWLPQLTDWVERLAM